jgi:hypothetical protein
MMTSTDKRAQTLDWARLDAEVDSARTAVTRIRSSPGAGLDHLLGVAPTKGFRRRAVRMEAAGHMVTGSPLAQLLDDIPAVVLVSGIAEASAERGRSADEIAQFAIAENVCTGWRTGGSAMRVVRAGTSPAAKGPRAPELISDDRLGWHHMPGLGQAALRRRRRMDIHLADAWEVDAYFRDTFVPVSGVHAGHEMVVHEYTLSARIDPATTRILRLNAVPRVLPFPECPAAVASARQLLGSRLAGLRERLHADFAGAIGCTHLTDMLRSLADVPDLATGRLLRDDKGCAVAEIE